MKCENCRNLVKRRDDDGTLYDWCGMVVDCPDRDLDRDCKYYQPASNADRIRAMSDEKLAEVVKNPCDIGYYMPREWCVGRNCGYQCSLDWIKQEAK